MKGLSEDPTAATNLRARFTLCPPAARGTGTSAGLELVASDSDSRCGSSSHSCCKSSRSTFELQSMTRMTSFGAVASGSEFGDWSALSSALCSLLALNGSLALLFHKT